MTDKYRNSTKVCTLQTLQNLISFSPVTASASNRVLCKAYERPRDNLYRRIHLQVTRLPKNMAFCSFIFKVAYKASEDVGEFGRDFVG